MPHIKIITKLVCVGNKHELFHYENSSDANTLQ